MFLTNFSHSCTGTADNVAAETLRQAITSVLDNKTCNEGYRGIFGSGQMPSTQLCAGRFEGGVSSCNVRFLKPQVMLFDTLQLTCYFIKRGSTST